MSRNTRQRSTHPFVISAKTIIAPPLAHRHHGRYRGRRRHLIVDTILSGTILLLLVTNVVLYFTGRGYYEPQLRITIDAPAAVVSGARQEYTLVVRNPNPYPMEDVALEWIAPDGWRATAPRTIGTLPAGIERRTTFSALTVGRIGDEQRVTVVAVAKRGPATFRYAGAGSWTVEDSVLRTDVSGPSDGVVGDPLTYTVMLTHTGDHPLTGVTVRTVLEGARIISAEPAMSADAAWILPEVRPKSATPLVMTLASDVPRQETLLVHVDLDGIAQVSAGLDVRVRTRLSADEIVNGAPAPSVSFAADARYFSADGMQFGYGPLPPEVGETTVYRVFWIVSAASAFRDGTVTAVLPAGTTWKGHGSVTRGQNVEYDAPSRTVTWRLGAGAADRGPVSASFELGLTPTSSMAGTMPALLTASTLRLVGAAGDERMFISPALTTASGGRPADEGRVRP